MVAAALGGAALNGGALNGPIQTLNDLWFAIFGAKSAEYAEKKAIQMRANLEEYQASIVNEVVKIEPENIQEPKISILGPAIEASKYYIEDEALRDMFAKLIASSMDKSKNDLVHNSFVEIIKQMSSLDAENLVVISSQANPLFNSICNLVIDYSDGIFNTKFTNLYLGNSSQKSQKNIGKSLSNLKRLGLIELDYQEYNENEQYYTDFRELSEYQQVCEKIDDDNQLFEAIRNYDQENATFSKKASGPRLQKGIIKITNYGQSFISVCLEEPFVPVKIIPDQKSITAY